MKGLLLHDWYQIKKYCRVMGIMALFFLVLYAVGGETFCLFYPVLLISLMPMTMLSYDEKSGWNRYCQNLPMPVETYVQGKYVMGLICLLPVLLCAGGMLLVFFGQGRLTLQEVSQYMDLLCLMGLVNPSLTLPFLFRFGTEKGRIAYYLVLGGLCGAVVLLSPYMNDLSLPTAILLPAAVLLYAASSILSVKGYKRRMRG